MPSATWKWCQRCCKLVRWHVDGCRVICDRCGHEIDEEKK